MDYDSGDSLFTGVDDYKLDTPVFEILVQNMEKAQTSERTLLKYIVIIVMFRVIILSLLNASTN